MPPALPPRNPDRLESWRQRMRGVSLPALCDEATWQALVAASDDPEASHDLIALDLPLALALLVEANRSPRIAADLSGLRHVLRLYGTARTRDWLHRWNGGRLDPGQPAHRLALQAMATSRLAWLFHARWMRHALVPDAEYRLWLTALLGVARWKLPLIDPEIALEVERRVEAGEPRRRVERALLGCDVDALSTLHLLDLGFADAPLLAARARPDPRLLGRSARLAREDAPPEAAQAALARRLREPLAACGLAYALALEAQADWHSRRCARLVKAAATCVGKPWSMIEYDMERAALEASRESLYTRGIMAPAARMIRSPQPDFVPAAVAPAQDAGSAGTDTPQESTAASTPRRPEPAPETATAAGHAAFFARCRSAGFASVAELLRASARLLAEAGLPRCALFLRMKQPERIAAYYSEGFGDPTEVRRAQFAPDAGALLARLLTDPRGAFWIQPKQLMGVRGKLPPALADWPPPGGFVLATVQANESPLGFWWADPGHGTALVDARQFAVARRMAEAFGAEFTRLIRAQRAAAAATA